MSDSIKITCEKCNHAIKAPRSAAGQRGKCPHCGSDVYVPTPPEELEEIGIAPLSENELQQEQRLDHETHQITAALLRDRNEAASESAKTGAATTPARAEAAHPSPALSGAALQDAIVQYVLAINRSELDEAEQLIQMLRAGKHQAKSRIQQLMIADHPPEALAQVPSGLYQGFLKKLLKELG
ncbi:MAG: hypothetical protein HJJLKODD_02076 [Phycisphaerae bacterium]|nr:hypothetical protein [Phycisphaerae bacterium]